MANVNVTSNAWTEISITSGTVQNISATADIELSAEQTDNSGVVLKPSEIYQWDNETIYARAVTEDTGALRVVNFKKAAGGGGYVLPVASASTLGGVKVGSNLSIDASGVLSATGGGAVNYSTTEQFIGTWIDETPLYQKTIIIQNVNISGTDFTTVDTTSLSEISGLNEIIEIACNVKVIGESEYLGNIGYCSASIDVEFNKDISVKQLWSTATRLCDAYITIRYTKTTD